MTTVNTNTPLVGDSTAATEKLRLELELCQRELDECRCRVGDLERGEALLAGENRLLQMVASGSPLVETLTALCRLIEELSRGSLCGILLVDSTGTRIEYATGPSLPGGYNEALQGLTVTPSAGPCGLAVCRKEQVIVTDLVTDARWDQEWRTLALSHGLIACWSTPILSSGGRVLGTFAIYWHEPRSPREQDQKTIAQVTHLASVAIERKRAEDGLRRGDAYLTEAQRLSRTGSFGWNVTTGQIIWSAETFCIMGYDPHVTPTLDLVLGRVHPDDAGLVQHTIDRATRDNAAFDFEHRLSMPNGLIKHVRVVAHPSKTDSGYVEFVGAVMDITEKKHAEDAIRAAKARFEGILEIAEDAIISVNSAQRIVLFNQGAEKVFGYDAAEVIGQSLNLLLPQRFAHAHPKHIEDFSKSPDVSRTMGQRREVFGRRKDGSEFPAEASISKLDLGGELFFTVILRDITERKRAAEALRASEHLARGQLEALASSLAALSRESVPEKFLEHVVRIAAEQLDAVGVSVWEMNELAGCVDLAANYQDHVLHLPARNQSPPPLRLTDASAEHPVWTEFFRTGKHCVYGRIENRPPWSEVAIHPDGPWYDWRAGMVDNPIVPQMIKVVAAAGIVATLNVPMLVADKVAGLFVLSFKHRRAYRPDEIELTRAMANQAMLAIKLMRLSQANRESAVIGERNRMARDIHDTLAQGFTGVIMQMEAAKGAAERNDLAEVKGRIDRAGELARSSLAEARRSVRALRLPSLQAGKLNLAIENLLKRMTDGSGLQAELLTDGPEGLLAADCEETLLRITQEALTNTIKHAQARNFRATLAIGESKTQIQLADDGRGFDPRAEHDGFGLTGMRERVERMNGEFVVRSMPGQGTEIVVILNHPNAHEQT